MGERSSGGNFPLLPTQKLNRIAHLHRQQLLAATKQNQSKEGGSHTAVADVYSQFAECAKLNH
jgi:hypothetical protein